MTAAAETIRACLQRCSEYTDTQFIENFVEPCLEALRTDRRSEGGDAIDLVIDVLQVAYSRGIHAISVVGFLEAAIEGGHEDVVRIMAEFMYDNSTEVEDLLLLAVDFGRADCLHALLEVHHIRPRDLRRDNPQLFDQLCQRCGSNVTEIMNVLSYGDSHGGHGDGDIEEEEEEEDSFLSNERLVSSPCSTDSK